MRRGQRWVAVAAALVLATPVRATVIGDATTPTQYVTYSEEVPCPPSARPRAVHHARPRRRPHRVSTHRIVRVKQRPAVHRAPLHRVRRRPLVRARQPVHSKRCSVLRRDRLTPASFGLTPESAVLTPVDDVVEPGGPAAVEPSSGRAAFGDGINPATGGGSPGGGGGEVVSAAPEPQTWLLMMLAVGLCGCALRRKPRVRLS